MDSLVLSQFRDSANQKMKALLTHRHFSGHSPDYDHIKRIDPELAFTLGENGVVVWEQDAERFPGRPGVVFTADGTGGDKVEASIRRNVADRATEADGFRLDRSLARCINEPNQVHIIKWLRGTPTREEFGLPAQ